MRKKGKVDDIIRDQIPQQNEGYKMCRESEVTGKELLLPEKQQVKYKGIERDDTKMNSFDSAVIFWSKYCRYSTNVVWS